jgi:putative hydrolase of the HAD superfamily
MIDPQSTKFRAVIFDVGGVLSTSPTPLMVQKALDSGVDLKLFAQLVLGPLDEDTDHPWHRAERGEITFTESQAAIQQLAIEAGFSSFPTAPTGDELAAFLQPIESMIAFAREVRVAGLKVGILTNNVDEWGRWRDKFSADELADVVVDSCEAGVRKPNPSSYVYVLEALGVSAHEAIFLDDFVWNVTGAQSVGLTAVHVTDHEVAIAETKNLLGWTT